MNGALAANSVNTAVDQALCFLTASRSYFNTSNPNGVTTAAYLDKTYTGTATAILKSLLSDAYPVWSINGPNDPYWNTAIDNLIGGAGATYSQIGQWFNACVANPTYDRTAYPRPNFPAGFEGWVQANNWLIRTFSPSHVTFGWQDNMWAAGSGFWLHNDLTSADIASIYATPVSSFLQQNAPSAIGRGALGAAYVPDFFVFDRYETDDSAAPGQATLYNARSWDNYLTAVGQVSRNFDDIPVMLWQIPGSHIPYVGEANPELYNDTPGLYAFSTAPVYFFADGNLQSDLGNIIAGPGSSTNSAVGNYLPNCGAGAYNCSAGSSYRQYLLAYQGQPNNFDWGKQNGKLGKAAANNVFAILWGGGNTTNVIKNFSNTDDHGWLAGKIIAYYRNPTRLPSRVATHDFNGDGKSDIVWRDTTGDTAIWLMNGAASCRRPGSGSVADRLVDRRPARLQRRRQGRPAVARHPRQHRDVVHERHAGRLDRERRQHPASPGRWSAPATSTATAWATSSGATPAAICDLADERRDRHVGRRARQRADHLDGRRHRRLQRRRQEPTSCGATPAATPRSGS